MVLERFTISGALLRRVNRGLRPAPSGLVVARAGSHDTPSATARSVLAKVDGSAQKRPCARTVARATRRCMPKFAEHSHSKFRSFYSWRQGGRKLGRVNVRSAGKEKTDDMPVSDFVEKIRA